MIRALAELPSTTARHTVDFWAGTALDGGRPAVRLAWVPRAAASARDPKAAQVTAVLTRGDARVFEGPVDPAGTIVAVPPGAIKVTLSVHDGNGEVIDREAKLVDVPDPEASPLWITSPAIFRAQNVREFRGLERGPTAMPFPGREFVRTDRLIIQFAVHGSAAPAAKISARIISQWGKDLAELPLAPRANNGRPVRARAAAGDRRARRVPDCDLSVEWQRSRARVRADKDIEVKSTVSRQSAVVSRESQSAITVGSH